MSSQHPGLSTLPPTLFRKIETFGDLEARIAALPGIPKTKGDALEVFAEGYLRTSPIWQVAELDLVGQLRLDWKRALNLSDADKNVGIDGAFRSKDDTLVTYQVKFHERRPPIRFSDVATFLGLTERGHHRVLITNCTECAEEVERRDRLRIVRGSDFDDLSREQLREIEHWIYGERVEPKRFTPRPYQQPALADIQAALADHPRATCVMACGTGKTLVALWAAEAQQPTTVLVLLPSLALLGQTLTEWSQHTQWGHRFEYLCVCSDDTVADKANDNWQIRPTDVPFPVSTDASVVRAFLSRPTTDAVRVVFSTYHSAPVVAAGMPDALSFDVGIFDEAHKTTGARDTRNAFALRDEHLRISKRLFFTATPRHIDVRHTDREGDFKVVSMDDPAIYGPQAHTLSFADAVAKGVICDYRVVVSVVDPQALTDADVRQGITLVQGDEHKTQWVATQVAVQRAIESRATKVITFHSRVSQAKEFASATSRGIGQFLDGFVVDHVNGTQPVSVRKRMLRGFATETKRLVTNARCLTEGVDLPAVDMVVFSSPRRSKVDIIQAVGRAMRKPSSGMKTVGYVVVPILLPHHEVGDVESAVADTNWEDLIDVLAALREHDVRLHATLQAIQIARGEGRPFNLRDLLDHIDVVGPQVLLEVLQDGIASVTVERLGESWDLRYGELVAYKKTHGDCRVPQLCPENPQLARWVSKQRERRKRGTLSPEQIRRLDELGFVWDVQDAAWEARFAELKAYNAQHGDCRVPQLYPENPQLATWVNTQRQFKKRGTLSPEQIRRLDELGFVWDPPRGARARRTRRPTD